MRTATTAAVFAALVSCAAGDAAKEPVKPVPNRDAKIVTDAAGDRCANPQPLRLTIPLYGHELTICSVLPLCNFGIRVKDVIRITYAGYDESIVWAKCEDLNYEFPGDEPSP